MDPATIKSKSWYEMSLEEEEEEEHLGAPKTEEGDLSFCSEEGESSVPESDSAAAALEEAATTRWNRLFAGMAKSSADSMVSTYCNVIMMLLTLYDYAGPALELIDFRNSRGVPPEKLQCLARFAASEDLLPPSLYSLSKATQCKDPAQELAKNMSSLWEFTQRMPVGSPPSGGLSPLLVTAAAKAAVGGEEVKADKPLPPSEPATAEYPLKLVPDEAPGPNNRNKLTTRLAMRQDDLAKSCAETKRSCADVDYSDGAGLDYFVKNLTAQMQRHLPLKLSVSQPVLQDIIPGFVTTPVDKTVEHPRVTSYWDTIGRILSPDAKDVWEPWIWSELIAPRIHELNKLAPEPRPMSIEAKVDDQISNPTPMQQAARLSNRSALTPPVPRMLEGLVDSFQVAEDLLANVAVDILRFEVKDSDENEKLQLAQQRQVMFITLAMKLMADLRQTMFHLRLQRKLTLMGFSKDIVDRRIGTFTKQPKSKTLISQLEMDQMIKEQLAEDARLMQLQNQRRAAEAAKPAMALKRPGPSPTRSRERSKRFFRRGSTSPRGRNPFRSGAGGRGQSIRPPSPTMAPPQRGQHGPRRSFRGHRGSRSG